MAEIVTVSALHLRRTEARRENVVTGSMSFKF